MLSSILLVENGPSNLETALLSLKTLAISSDIIVARDGKEAIDYLLCRDKHSNRRTGNPGMVLLDLKLPAVEAITVLKTIKGIPTLSSVPVIVLTESPNKTEAARTVALGIDDYTIKPMGLQDFVNQMHRLASRFAKP